MEISALLSALSCEEECEAGQGKTTMVSTTPYSTPYLSCLNVVNILILSCGVVCCTVMQDNHCGRSLSYHLSAPAPACGLVDLYSKLKTPCHHAHGKFCIRSNTSKHRVLRTVFSLHCALSLKSNDMVKIPIDHIHAG